MDLIVKYLKLTVGHSRRVKNLEGLMPKQFYVLSVIMCIYFARYFALDVRHFTDFWGP